ncbi:hypothetical protein BD414DRAFT_480986 [Trametes punicea]|nr:hypothetical protein BD414DRAFT_480986 [Trametes punicea]
MACSLLRCVVVWTAWREDWSQCVTAHGWSCSSECTAHRRPRCRARFGCLNANCCGVRIPEGVGYDASPLTSRRARPRRQICK